MKKAEQSFEFATLARSRFEKSSPEARRELVAALAEDSNLVLTNKMLDFKETSPLFIIRKAARDNESLRPTFEPAQNLSQKTKSTSEDEMRFVWLSIVDEFRTANWVKIKSELAFSGTLALFPSPSI